MSRKRRCLEMKRVSLKHIPLRINPWEKWPGRAHQVFLWTFLAHYVLCWFRIFLPNPPFGEARWPDGILVVLAAGTTLASLVRGLPLQNVMLASFIIGSAGAAAHTLTAVSGIPFGPLKFTRQIGQELFHPLPWAIPIVWIVIVLTARGVARLILRPRRRSPTYGFEVLGFGTMLVIVLDLGLEPFATQVKGFWSWEHSRSGWEWYGAPWVNFVGWAVTTVLILAFATPALINKKPVNQVPPPDYHPLLIWFLLNLLFLTGAVAKQLRSAAIVIGLVTLLVSVLALLGARAATQSTNHLKSEGLRR
jgi:uncharacterized membrane protein